MIPEDDLFAQLRDASLALEELKNRQTVGGDSTAVRKIVSAAAYDRTVTLSGAGTKQVFTASFTADRQAFALADLRAAVFKGSPSTPAVLYDDYFANIMQLPGDPATPLLTRWRVELYKQGSGSLTFFLKWVVMSVDTGTVS